MINKTVDRIGVLGKNAFGSEMEIVEYKNCMDITVKFIQYGNLVKTRWSEFKKGQVRNVYDKSVFAVGYLGDGNYKPTINGKETKQYSSWHGMMKRCYSRKALLKNPTYKDCSVTKEWHDFQEFSKWCDENYYEIEGEVTCLDKDILIKGNKLYSPEGCVFAPSRINSLFTKTNSNRGKYPIGVSLHTNNKNYLATCGRVNGKRVNVGSYDNPQDAFNSYKKYKERLIKQIAEEYKNKIPNQLYKAMMIYEVDIND